MKKFILGEFEVNCYILNYQDECYLVDPGEYSEEINEIIKEYDFKGILLTHGHLDHINAIDKYPGPIYIHRNDYDNLFDDSLSGYNFFNKKHHFNANNLHIVKISENDSLPLGDSYIDVIHTPGHTRGSVCYLFKNSLFSGDTIFKNGIGRTDLPGGSEKDIKKSVVKIIDNVKDFVKIYPGHESETTIKNEKNNPYYLSFKKLLNK